MSTLKYHRTRFPELDYANICKGVWSFFNVDPDGRRNKVGPHYASKVELLCDLERYAKEFGL
jgi:hypothetical protein